MRIRRDNERGVLLIISMVVMVVLAVLTSVYLMTIVTEKHSTDSERFVIQAVHLAEAGANHAWAEMRSRIETDLRLRMENYTPRNQQGSALMAYVTSDAALEFLHDHAYPSSGTQFEVQDEEAVLTIATDIKSGLNSAIEGDTITSTLRIVSRQAPTGDAVNQIYRFYYTYTVEATARLTRFNPPMVKTIAFAPNDFDLVVRQDNFAKYALFTFHHRTPSGTTVWFTADTNFFGPVHTNERFSFANAPSAHFTNEVTQSQGTARFYNNGSSILLDADHNGSRDVPQFDNGFLRSQDTIPLPAAISQTELRDAALGGMAVPGTSSPGVYVPESGGTLTGGIYLNGNSGQSSDNPTVVMSVDGSNNAVYTITQYYSHANHTTVITVDNAANTTTVVSDGVSTTYNGKPDGNTHEGTIIYANDDIAGFSGTVQQDTQITVSGERDIVISGNVMYQAYNTTPNLNAAGYNNLLGILSWGGDVRIGTTAPDDVNVHAVVMAPHGVFTVDDYSTGSSRGTATLLGGVISDWYGAFGTFSGTSGMRTGYGRNFIYDDRVLQGMAPPYFPYMDRFTIDNPVELSRKMVWREMDE
ncbi:MAG TPA: DUF4900 domain-containing protein [Candidatus Omnitrophota bacterium]|nr:DUF4900 domain-containing protein [Candidatus Omnitrophota bacterium]HNQ50210.1 DUF4900 domain-containing protein [Candidatus Omnitrophota bacterium]HQQ06547.1 DUF4900 domain-containing protein [Candidatus Omnitrophota bacterium]